MEPGIVKISTSEGGTKIYTYHFHLIDNPDNEDGCSGYPEDIYKSVFNTKEYFILTSEVLTSSEHELVNSLPSQNQAITIEVKRLI